MKLAAKPLTKTEAWKALASHHKEARKWHLRKLFVDNPKRGEQLTLEAAGLYLD